ncbi:hypothetical protein OF83DRAFT_42220 [Amylostereum chailletii]|nr:hypothetical protein OF83DRAFT_42220 [Amylostereum chailletii]
MSDTRDTTNTTVIVAVVCGVLALIALLTFWFVKTRSGGEDELPSSSTSTLRIKNPTTSPLYSNPSVQMGAASPLFIQSIPSSLSFLGSLGEKPQQGEHVLPATPHSLLSARSSYYPPPTPPLRPLQPVLGDQVTTEVQVDTDQTYHETPAANTAGVHSWPRTPRAPKLWRSRSRRKKSSDTSSVYSSASAPHDQHNRILSLPPSYPPQVLPFPQFLSMPSTLPPALSTSTSDGLRQFTTFSRSSTPASHLPPVTPSEIERILDRMMRTSMVDPVLPHADQSQSHNRHRLGTDSIVPITSRQSMHALTTEGLPPSSSLPVIELPLSAYPRLQYSLSDRGRGTPTLRSILPLRVRPVGPRKRTS